FDAGQELGLKPHVFKAKGKWVLADWCQTLPHTGARICSPLREADTVRGLQPKPSLLQKIVAYIKEVW
ncbi:hypothetical protein, partial [Streptococcus pseudopneumoniae]|uniref:hypothetical protein n=1 Tax=Streptococcus pseudopneumoniae TaxID=257758 RepID=UPI0019D510C2